MNIRPPAVAGSFYPAEAESLRREIARYLLPDDGEAVLGPAPKALVVPHAGIIYSGKTAGIGYSQLAPAAGSINRAINRVILLGPTHRVGIRGMAVPSVDAFATPLGLVPIDAAARALALGLPRVAQADAPHAFEHCLEVQLPFLQSVLERFTVLPIAVGEAGSEEVASVLDALWGGPETLIVISTDLSHFHPYVEAQEIDLTAVEAVLAMNDHLGHQQACGATPLNGLLRTARRRGMRPTLLDLCNSGDTAGDKRRVVGYAAFRFD